MRRTCLTVAILALLGVPRPGAAQDFLFGRPEGSLGIELGVSVPRAGSEVFDFTTRHLTVDRRDFVGIAMEGEVARWLTPRIDGLLSLGYSFGTVRSEFRDFVDTEDRPIEQETSLGSFSASVGARLHLLPRGREVGSLAWIPAVVSPYVGAEVGLVHYVFRQEGDFVDFDSLVIFTDELESRGWGGQVAAAAGVEVSVGARTALSVEGRYRFADAEMGGRFVGFEEIDLRELETTVGVRWRF